MYGGRISGGVRGCVYGAGWCLGLCEEVGYEVVLGVEWSGGGGNIRWCKRCVGDKI